MKSNILRLLMPVLLVTSIITRTIPSFAAEDVTGPLIKALASENEAERTQAIDALQKMGDAMVEPLRKVEADVKLASQQLILVRKLIGDRLTSTTTLQPMDLSKVAPFGEEKEKGIAGDPNLLINREAKIIVMNGEFVLEQGPLDYLVCMKHTAAKLHETVAGVYARPRDICYALLACAFTYAGEMDEHGSINLPKEAGIFISIEYEWEPVNAKLGLTPGGPKKTIRVPIEFFATNAQTHKPMKRSPFAFTGSKFEKLDNGKMEFIADIEKSIVALKYDQYAIMNTLLDTKDANPYQGGGYNLNPYSIPPRGTKCRVIFEPWSGGELKKDDLTDTVKGKEKAPVAPIQTEQK
ncbi:MAG: YdjY domain-containing protein [Planctomycetota bacterium]